MFSQFGLLGAFFALIFFFFGLFNNLISIVYVSGSSCKNRWSNIRDNYRKSLKKIKTVSGQKEKAVRPYKFSQQLSFLKKFFDERDTMTNIDDELTHQDGTGHNEGNEEKNENTVTEENTITTLLDNSSREVHSHSLPSVSQQCSRNMSEDVATTSTGKQSPRKTRKHFREIANPAKTTAATVMEYLVKKSESMAQAPPPQDEVDAFLAGIAPVLKKLTPRDWHYAKGEIFGTVQKYELVALDNQYFSDTPSFSGATSESPTESIRTLQSFDGQRQQETANYVEQSQQDVVNSIGQRQQDMTINETSVRRCLSEFYEM